MLNLKIIFQRIYALEPKVLPEPLTDDPIPLTPPAEPETDDPVPSRERPFPGKKPRPVIDPKNLIEKLIPQYFLALPTSIQKLTLHCSPFTELKQLKRLEQKMEIQKAKIINQMTQKKGRADLMLIFNAVPGLYAQIKRMQQGKEERILILIHQFLKEIFSETLYQKVANFLELKFSRPQTVEFDENEEALFFGYPELSEEQMAELGEAIPSGEIFNLFLQGFSILAMQGFPKMMQKELEQISPGLADAYDDLFLYCQFTQIYYFEAILNNRASFEMLEQAKKAGGDIGLIEHHTRPIENENGQIVGMDAYAKGSAEFGAALAHEGLKGVAQLLMPFAKLRENYLDDAQLFYLRMALNSASAEIRQFALGPAFYFLLQDFLLKLGLSGQLNDPQTYLVIQNFILMKKEQRQEVLEAIFNSETKLTSLQKEKFPKVLLADLLF